METLLVGLVAAIVGLLVGRISQGESRWMLNYSKSMLDMAFLSIRRQEDQQMIASRVHEMAQTIEKLDATVGNLYLQFSRRTLLDRPAQVGEVPPGAPPIVRTRAQDPDPFLPQPTIREGLVDTTEKNAVAQVRERAFAEPT